MPTDDLIGAAVAANPATMTQWLADNPGGEKVAARITSLLAKWESDRRTIRAQFPGAEVDGRHVMSRQEREEFKRVQKAINRELRGFDRAQAVERHRARGLIEELIRAFRGRVAEYRSLVESNSVEERNRQHLNQVVDNATAAPGAGNVAAAQPISDVGDQPEQKQRAELPPELLEQRDSLIEQIEATEALTDAERARAKFILSHDLGVPVFKRDARLSFDVAKYWGGQLWDRLAGVAALVSEPVIEAARRLSKPENPAEPTVAAAAKLTLEDVENRDKVDVEAAKANLERWMEALPARVALGQIDAVGVGREFEHKVVDVPHDVANDCYVSVAEQVSEAASWARSMREAGHSENEIAEAVASWGSETGGRHRGAEATIADSDHVVEGLGPAVMSAAATPGVQPAPDPAEHLSAVDIESGIEAEVATAGAA